MRSLSIAALWWSSRILLPADAVRLGDANAGDDVSFIHIDDGGSSFYTGASPGPPKRKQEPEPAGPAQVPRPEDDDSAVENAVKTLFLNGHHGQKAQQVQQDAKASSEQRVDEDIAMEAAQAGTAKAAETKTTMEQAELRTTPAPMSVVATKQDAKTSAVSASYGRGREGSSVTSQRQYARELPLPVDINQGRSFPMAEPVVGAMAGTSITLLVREVLRRCFFAGPLTSSGPVPVVIAVCFGGPVGALLGLFAVKKISQDDLSTDLAMIFLVCAACSCCYSILDLNRRKAQREDGSVSDSDDDATKPGARSRGMPEQSETDIPSDDERTAHSDASSGDEWEVHVNASRRSR
eukprot:TRINITY_DN33229_c0_g1_i1.p1 TRINITY_DN33229_c0_g1~~TRINITY_DN33229_c0_g1_i1.p1  ORF type:complete len:351 (-),score=77.06 TRINITY_DN33229_c0_g1_i1:93-1145(-)